MTSLKLAAVDLGASSGRVMLATFDGRRLQLEEAHRFPNIPVQVLNGLHWDALRLFAEIKHGLALCTRSDGARSGALAGIGLDTWGVDFALLDRDGALLGNPYHYRDPRTEGMQARAFARVPREEIFARTGIQFLSINTLYQLLALAEARAPALELAHTLLTMPDLFNYWLAGRQAAEFTNATTTQMVDPRARDWAWPMLEALGLPARILPPVVPPGTVLGTLLAPVAAELGGAAGVPVIAPACHDTGSAVAAVPTQAGPYAYISSGTWSLVGVETEAPVITPASLAGNFTNEGGVAGTVRLLKNVMGLWLLQESRRAWAEQGTAYSYDQLVQLAQSATPYLALLDPDDPEFLRPGDMPARIRAACARNGQPLPRTQAQVVRCIYESLALKYRRVIEQLEALLGHALPVIHVIGGGARNALLCQWTADATGRPVIAGPVEAAAAGNALVQALALGRLGSLADARHVVRDSFELRTYEPQPSGAWDEAYARFLELLAARPGANA